ncbi:MAG: cation diffusion facilitator family transporter [Caulobacteraceae bacterium]|nr:cation diffusion facilitator family transporter [Caulobacteraceae bacterium]
MASQSAKVVHAALAGNVVIAVAKFAAFGLTGSSAMLTEAIHSTVDTTDQVLLLIGEARSQRAPDANHPLGYGMEIYFWSFVVAVMVLMLGGVVSLYDGVTHILKPEPLASPFIGFGVLAFAAVFEGASFAFGYREYRRIVQGRRTRLWAFIKLSKDPSLYTTLLEDSAALIGLVLAAIGQAASVGLHILWADGAASVAIGLLMTAVAAVLANETRSLIIGEGVTPLVLSRLRKVLEAEGRVADIVEISTLHLGPRSILVALTVRFRPDLTIADVSQTIRDITAAMQEAEDRIAYVYVRPASVTEP